MLSRVVACSLTLALACSLAHATTWQFTDYYGDHKWNTALNWDDLQGHHQVPGTTDTAIIPNGETCNIESGSDGGAVAYLTVNGTLTVYKSLYVGYDVTVAGTMTVYDDTTIGYTLTVSSAGTVASHEKLKANVVDVYGTLELWPNTDDDISLDLGINGSNTTHTLDGAIYFEDDNTNDAHYPTLHCKSGGTLTFQPSSAQEDGLISASAGDSAGPGVIKGC